MLLVLPLAKIHKNFPYISPQRYTIGMLYDCKEKKAVLIERKEKVSHSLENFRTALFDR